MISNFVCQNGVFTSSLSLPAPQWVDFLCAVFLNFIIFLESSITAKEKQSLDTFFQFKKRQLLLLVVSVTLATKLYFVNFQSLGPFYRTFRPDSKQFLALKRINYSWNWNWDWKEWFQALGWDYCIIYFKWLISTFTLKLLPLNNTTRRTYKLRCVVKKRFFRPDHLLVLVVATHWLSEISAGNFCSLSIEEEEEEEKCPIPFSLIDQIWNG